MGAQVNEWGDASAVFVFHLTLRAIIWFFTVLSIHWFIDTLLCLYRNSVVDILKGGWMCRLYNNGVNIYDSVCAYKMNPCMQIVSYHFYLEEKLVNNSCFCTHNCVFCALKVLIESFHCFFAVEWRLRAAVLLLFVMSVWTLWFDSEIAQKTRSAVIVPCLLLIVSLRPVLLFYLYFSFTHSAIIF